MHRLMLVGPWLATQRTLGIFQGFRVRTSNPNSTGRLQLQVERDSRSMCVTEMNLAKKPDLWVGQRKSKSSLHSYSVYLMNYHQSITFHFISTGSNHVLKEVQSHDNNISCIKTKMFIVVNYKYILKRFTSLFIHFNKTNFKYLWLLLFKLVTAHNTITIQIRATICAKQIMQEHS